MKALLELTKEQLEAVKVFNAASSFNGVYSRNNAPEIKDWAYIINLDEFTSIRTHWIALYVNGNGSSN